MIVLDDFIIFHNFIRNCNVAFNKRVYFDAIQLNVFYDTKFLQLLDELITSEIIKKLFPLLVCCTIECSCFELHKISLINTFNRFYIKLLFIIFNSI